MEPIISRRIDTLHIEDLQRVVDERAASHYTARNMRTVLSKLYQRAMAERRARVNLPQFIVLPELNECEAEPFTQDEVSKMWDTYNRGRVYRIHPFADLHGYDARGAHGLPKGYVRPRKTRDLGPWEEDYQAQKGDPDLSPTQTFLSPS